MEELPSYKNFTKEIEAMCIADQDMRRRSMKAGGVIESDEDDVLDAKNTERMKEIVDAMGWPTISKVGPEISNQAWLLVQHADHDLAFQKHCLELMKNAPEGEVSKRNMAFLEDRIRVNERKRQLYGTQFHGEGESYGPRPIEDPENVDKRRAEMGMETQEEYAKALKDKYLKNE